MLDKCKKKVLLLDTIGVWKELVIAFRRILAAVHTIIEDLAFFLIRLVVCICL